MKVLSASTLHILNIQQTLGTIPGKGLSSKIFKPGQGSLRVFYVQIV